MKKKLPNSSKLYLFALLLLVIDTIFMGIFEQHILALLLCFYANMLLKTAGPAPLVYIVFLLASQSLVIDGYFGFSLLYILPLSIAALEAKNLLSTTAWLPYAFIFVSVATDKLFIKQYLLQTPVFPFFILVTICVNLIVGAIFENYFSQR